MPKITVGLPTFNRSDSLTRSIELILSQTYSDFELIIYDDGSSDNTTDILSSLNDPRISYFSFNNAGPPTPLNFILDRASGDYIIFLHDHDIFASDLLEKCVHALDQNHEIGFVLPGGVTIDHAGKASSLAVHNFINKSSSYLIEIFSNRKSFALDFHACSMVRMSAMDEVGKFYNRKYGFYSDVELWLRLLQKFNFIYLQEPLLKFTSREADHLLNGKEISTINNLYSIHFDKIAEIFPNEIDKYTKILQRKYFYEVLMICIASIANSRLQIFEQFAQIEEHYISSRLRYFIIMILSNPFITWILLTLNKKKRKFFVR